MVVYLDSGGETPLLRSDIIYKRVLDVHPEFCHKLEKQGVVYTRTIPENDDKTSAIGRGWTNTFNAADRDGVELAATGLGVSLEWQANGDVKTISPKLPAIRTVNGRKVWFNSVIASYTGTSDSRNDSTKMVCYADGSLLDPVHVNDTVKLMSENAASIPWQNGDVFWIDNNQVLHSRAANFTPPRKIMAFLGADCPYEQ